MKLNPELELCSEKVLLRPLQMNDLKEFVHLSSDAGMWKYFTHDLSIEAELEQWVQAAFNQSKDGTRQAFTIVDLKTKRVAGSTSFGSFSQRDQRIEIGWTWLGKEFQGGGINSEIKYLMLQYCFETIDILRVELKTDVLNKAARRGVEKIGMVEEGILRSHTLVTHARRRDSIYYSLLRSEWDNVKKKNKWS